LKLESDEQFSNVAFNFKLRSYTEAVETEMAAVEQRASRAEASVGIHG